MIFMFSEESAVRTQFFFICDANDLHFLVMDTAQFGSHWALGNILSKFAILYLACRLDVSRPVFEYLCEGDVFGEILEVSFLQVLLLTTVLAFDTFHCLDSKQPFQAGCACTVLTFRHHARLTFDPKGPLAKTTSQLLPVHSLFFI